MSDFSSESPNKHVPVSIPMLHLTDTILEDEDEEEKNSETMWSRLHQAAEGQIKLNNKDAEVIMAAFQKTLENGEREREFLKAGAGNEVDYLSRRRNEIVISMKQQLMTARSGDNDNDDVLKYLTSHYLPMAVLTDELDEKDGSDSRGNSPYQDMEKRDRDSLSSGGGEVSCTCTQVHGREYKIDATGEPSPIGKVDDWFMSSELQDYLFNITTWEFDIFGLKKLTKWPLRVVGVAAAREIKMFDRNEFNEEKFDSFLVDVSRSYCKNPYHNALHAADVVQTCLHFLTTGQLLEASGISALATAGLLIAAAVHDVGHPGSNNHFLTATSAPLAIQYNDHSPLENMHLATAFSLMQRPANNFVETLSPQVRKELRRIIIAMVLATDNDRHFGMHGQLEALVNAQRAKSGFDVADDTFIGTLTRKKSNNSLILHSSQSEIVHSNSNSNNNNQILKTPITSSSQRSSFTQISPMNTNDDTNNDNNSRRGSGSVLSSRRNSSATIDNDDVNSVVEMRRRASGVSPMLEQAFRILMASQKELDVLSTETSPRDTILPEKAAAEDGRCSFTRVPLSISRRQSASMLSRDSSLNSKTPQSNVFTRNRQPSVNSVSSLERHGLSIERAGTPAQQNFHLSTQPSDAIQVLLLESALHMADISNPVKPWEIYQRWLSRVMEEFYNQGDKERLLDMPITFGFDRNNPIPQSKFQLGFMKVIVSPLYVTYSRLPGINLGHCLVSMNKNIDHWTQMEADPVVQTVATATDENKKNP